MHVVSEQMLKLWVISESRSTVLHIYAKNKLCFGKSYFAPRGGPNKALTVRGPLYCFVIRHINIIIITYTKHVFMKT